MAWCLRLRLSGWQFTNAILAGHELITAFGDPQVDFIADPGNARKVEHRRDQPAKGQPPGHPAERSEAVVNLMPRGRN